MAIRKRKENAGDAAALGFPIVGIGASAGGLEAFEQFFRHLAPDSGIGFVLVPHLDPEHASLLSEILQRSTTMPVVEVEDQMAVAPNRVHVVPPNRDMEIFHGVLQLSVPEAPRGQRMPIDAFMRSLADDQGERATGILLSGTGSDGSLGLCAILNAGGITFVQEPASARYSGMPASAIQAGYATQILTVEQMPAALLESVRTFSGRHSGASAKPAPATSINRILMLLRNATGHDFACYKKNTIRRRVERRMSQHAIENPDVYARYLKEHPAEVRVLFKELLINVTHFFRDPEAFVTLRQEILPQICAGKDENAVLRVWVAGCSSGEEAYSIAIVLREFFDESGQEFGVQIYATDIDDDAIAVARSGIYPAPIAQDVSRERLRRFFVKDETGFRVRKEIREMVVFAVQNIIKDPPFTRLDLLSCRNLMIYFEPELQHRLIPLFHYALRANGVLFLSPSESVGRHCELFKSLNRKWKFYRATHSAASTRAAMNTGPNWEAATAGKAPEDALAVKPLGFVEHARRTLLQTYAPPSVVTDLQGNILYVHGETGRYLSPAPGQATLNVIDMAHEGLQLELRMAIQQFTRPGRPPLSREVSVKVNGGFQGVTFSVRPLSSPDTGEGWLLVSFQDVTNPVRQRRGKRKTDSAAGSLRRIDELERDLAYTRENLQATIEEQQASNEELKSTNEEVQSTNEELQSTNEELETSKEELQSVNEELVTVNSELQAKIEQLASMQNDLKNLLDNVSTGTVFLDQRLVIRRFTREAAGVYRLVPSDVGRSLGDIKCDLEGEDLLAESQAVLDSLLPWEREVRTIGGVTYLARIRPYRTFEHVIDGVVLTFIDISQRVAAEKAARQAQELAEGIVDTVREPLIVLNEALQVVSASHAFYRVFAATPEATVGRRLYELDNRQWDIPVLRNLLESVLPRDRSFEDYPVEYDFPDIGKRRLLLNARRIVGRTTDTPLILLAIEDSGGGLAARRLPETPG